MSAQRWSDGEVAKLIPRLETLMEVDPTNVPRDNYLDALMDLRDARAEAARLRAVLIEAQECIDYGTRAGGAAEVLAHIATVLKGDGHATVTRGSATTGREMAVVEAAKKHAAWARDSGYTHTRDDLTLTESALVAAVDRLTEAQGKGDESWQARRAELLAGVVGESFRMSIREAVAAALDRAFEFGREGRS